MLQKIQVVSESINYSCAEFYSERNAGLFNLLFFIFWMHFDFSVFSINEPICIFFERTILLKAFCNKT